MKKKKKKGNRPNSLFSVTKLVLGRTSNLGGVHTVG